MKWKQEKRKIEDLKPATYNPRIKLSGKKLRDLMNSLDEFDLAVPLVINTDNTIIGGHQRYYILQRNGTKEVPVQVPEKKLTAAQEKRLNIRLNKNTGEWDLEKMLEHFDIDDLQKLGFELEELELPDFGNFGEEDTAKKKKETEDLMHVETIEFIPEDHELFNKEMEKIKVDYKSPVRATTLGLKIAKLLRGD